MIKAGYENKALGESRIITIENKSAVTLKGVKSGNRVTVAADAAGVPSGTEGHYWRRALKDAEIDGCVEIVRPSKKGGK